MSLTRRERNLLRVQRYRQINASRNPYESVLEKTCYRCRKSLPSQSFTLDATKRDGLQSYCKPCARKQRIESLYNISYSDYELLLIEQNHLCAICQKRSHSDENPLAVDHCHNSLTVRGLLCRYCNQGIGMLNDDCEILRRATSYLEGKSI